jgi:hypothetical protein
MVFLFICQCCWPGIFILLYQIGQRGNLFFFIFLVSKFWQILSTNLAKLVKFTPRKTKNKNKKSQFLGQNMAKFYRLKKKTPLVWIQKITFVKLPI